MKREFQEWRHPLVGQLLPIMDYTVATMRIALLVVLLPVLACGSSESTPDGGDAGPALTDSSPSPAACGERVSEADCQRCGVPSPAVCARSGPPAPACSDPPGNPYACCYYGLGTFCSCDGTRWGVVVCDPPPRDAGPPPDTNLQGPPDAPTDLSED